MDKLDKRTTNYRMVSRLLVLGGLILILVRRYVAEPESSILGYIGLTLIFAAAIQMILFYIKPGSFKDKSSNPDEENANTKE